MNKYLFMTILQLFFIIMGLVVSKVTTSLRRNRTITKRMALTGYAVAMICLFVIPILLNKLSSFIAM